MKKILFIQHGDTDRPGLLAEALDRSQVGMEILHPYAGDAICNSINDFAGIALGGGMQSAYQWEEYPYLRRECELIQQAAHSGKPVLGLCLGAQLMASALGGSVGRAPQHEIGFYPITLDPAAQCDPLWNNLPTSFIATHWHSDIFTLPPHGIRLGSSELTPNQLFRCGRGLYGFQFHLEMTPELFEDMITSSRDYLVESGADPERLLQEARHFLPSLRKTAEIVFSRWAALL